MADNSSTPPESTTTRTFKIPVEGAAPDTHQHRGREFRIPVENKSFSIPVEASSQAVTPTTGAENPPKAPYEPSWWQRAKKDVEGFIGRNVYGNANYKFPSISEGMHNLLGDHPGQEVKQAVKEVPSTVLSASTPGGMPVVSPTANQSVVQEMLVEGAKKGNVAAKTALQLQEAAAKPRVEISDTKFFQSHFDPHSQNRFSRFVTGTTKAVEGMTSLDNLYSLAAMSLAPESAAKPMGAMFQAQLVAGGAQGVADASEKSAHGDKAAASEAWGNLFGNALTAVGIHYGTKGIENFKERDNTKVLNDHAQDIYEKKFSDLNDDEKTNVLYSAIADASPRLKERVNREAERIVRKRGAKGEDHPDILAEAQKQGVAPAKILSQNETNTRIEAAKTVIHQIVTRRVREEAYRVHEAAKEAETRRILNEDGERRRAEEAQAKGQQPEVAVEDKRHNAERGFRGPAMTTEREGQMFNPEPETPPAPKVEDRRFWIGDHEPATTHVAAAERPVQTFAEDRMGVSFDSLPWARQKVVARYFERFQPEQWQAFQSTPAYAAYERRGQIMGDADVAWKRYLDRTQHGENTSLVPNADLHAGLSRLILARTNIDSALQADPETHRALNESSEKSMGRSFDSLAPEDRVSALGEFLREQPDKVSAFLTPDLSERIASGQHIDLANMDAELRDRQQVELLMSERDSIRRSMDAEASQRMVVDERSRQHAELAQQIPFDSDAAKGLTALAEKLNLGPITSTDDLFRIADDARHTTMANRIPAYNEFLARMRQARAAAEDHILRELAEATANQFRANGEGAKETAIREVINFSSQADDLERVADHLAGTGKKAEAATVRETANFVQRKADAVTAGAEAVLASKAESIAPKIATPVAVGRETRVVYPANEAGLPAHYVLMDADDLQTSHLPLSYEYRPGYNQAGQPRDYKTNQAAQAAIESRSGSLDLDQLLSTGVTTMEGPAVVDQRAHVISGNGRSLYVLTSMMRRPEQFHRYVQALRERIGGFGIDPNDVSRYKHPVLVKMLDVPIKNEVEWARLGIEMNRDPMMGLSESEQGAALARMLAPEYQERLARIIDTLPLVDDNGHALTVREAMRKKSSAIAELMQDAGVISANKTQEFLTPEGDLKEKAKDLFENMLAGLTVTDSNVLERSSASTKDKLARAGLFFLRMKAAGEDWNLASMNTDAVTLLTRAQNRAAELRRLEVTTPGEIEHSLVDRMLHPEKYRLSNFEMQFDDQPLHGPVHPAVEALARALEEPPKTYTSKIAKYASAAEGVQESMFGAEHPAYVFNREIGNDYGIKVDPAEWGMVHGLPESLKESIERGRDPLPVEPEAHAETVIENVQPESASVTEAQRGAEPRSVKELREALAKHPGFDDEKADAVTQLFTEIIPRVTGYSAEETLANRRLNFQIGGAGRDETGSFRGYHEIAEDGRAIINLANSADPSTFLHEMAHYLRLYMSPGDQAIANGFVGAKPGAEWTEAQDEKFATAFERYHYDGGIRRGKLEQVFAKLSRWMQQIYNSVTVRDLAKGTPELNAMFDKWYDWERSERKPITKRLDVAALEDAAKGVVQIPEDAKRIGGRGPLSDSAQSFVFLSREDAENFVSDKKKGITAWEMLKPEAGSLVYVKADVKRGRRLHQAALNDAIGLARRARELEDQLKRTHDPREQARLRGLLNGVEDKLRGSTLVFGGKVEPPDTSATQLIYGVSEMPTVSQPTTPAQAVTARQTLGDPTAVELGGEHGRKGRISDETAGVREEGKANGVHEPEVPANGKHGNGKATPLAKPDKHPLADVKAAKLKAPDRQRGTPVVDPDTWRGQVETLGLPEGTPPPTLRISPELREMAIYPGQAEAMEGALSALQQYDGTVLAAPTGSGKTFMLSAIASELLGADGDKVGLIVTRSQNLIHDADGYVEWGRKVGVTVDGLPQKSEEIQTGGVYAATYAQIRGARDVFSVPWDFVLFDESAEARNWTDSEQGKAVVLLGHAANKVVYASATPYHTVMELGYMHKLGMWPQGGFTQWAEQFGLREIGPNTFTGGMSAAKLEKLRQQLIERGQWQSLYKDMDGVQAHVAMVPQTPEIREGVRRIRSAFAMAAKAFQAAGMSRYLTPTAGHEAIYLKRYIEGARLPQVIAKASEAIKAGWKPILFSEYRSGAETGMEFFHHLPGDLGKKINAMLPPLPDVVAALRKEFGNGIGIFAGDANQLRSEELEQYMAGNKDALYMTFAAGGVGANAQDKVGDRPRMAMFLGLPWSGIMFEQAMGRPWRYGTKSNVASVFFTSDTLPEMKLLATKILPRMRAVRAAVYGEKMESQLSKDLRESVGIPEEMLQYEQGQEVKTDAAQFEQDGNGARFTNIEDFEMPDAKDAMHRGMKYKGRRLYQGPVEEDPFQKAAREAWEQLLERAKNRPAPGAAAVTSNAGVIRVEAAAAGQRAMGTGEPVDSAIHRKTRDMENDILVALDDLKDNSRKAAHALRSTGWQFATSGDRAIEKIFKAAGMPKEGAEMKRRIVDYDIRSGNYRGELGGMVAKIIHDNRLTPPEHELVTKVIEGTATSDDPRINKAANEYRKFFAYVRQRLADTGNAVVIYEDGKRKEIPYSKIADDPHYWPRIYDWNQKIVIRDPQTGGKTVTSLGKLMDMPTTDERRELLIDKIAQQKGISKLQAQAFFDKRVRGIRLAGNVERAREFDIPMYGRDRRAIERYVNEVAEKLAAAEVHGVSREKTDALLDQLPERSGFRSMANHIVTSDLKPVRLNDEDRFLLRNVNRGLILSKMTLSFLKVGFHQVKTSLATNTRSVAMALIQDATHPHEVYQNAVDSGAMVDYVRSAWMREYGLGGGWLGNVDQHLLQVTGFTPLMYFTRMTAAAAGRLWLEKYAYPALAKDPKNQPLRRKLSDLYGYTDEQLDHLAANGYGPEDVKRVSLAAANWTTGSGRPSELPAALRGGDSNSYIFQRYITLMRIAQSLHGFMFKTANLVNRTVWQELFHGDWKTGAPYHLIGRFAVNFGFAGSALDGLLYLRHRVSGSNEADREKRRLEWLKDHKLSSEAVAYAMRNLSMAMGTEVLTQFFELLATHDPKDRQKLSQQHRVLDSIGDLLGGPAVNSMWFGAQGVFDYAATFSDTGNHRQTPEERRKKILDLMMNQEIPVTRLFVKPKPAPPAVYHRRRRRASTVLR